MKLPTRRRPFSVKPAGFTLIELLITIALLAVLMALAAPSFGDASVNSKVSDNANRLASSAAFARGEAIKRNGVIVMCMSADGDTCAATGGWEQGWMVFHDINRDGAKGADETRLHKEQSAPTGYKITETDTKLLLSFQPTSVGSTNATWTICRATPAVATTQRQVDVSATGRASVKRITGSTCA